MVGNPVGTLVGLVVLIGRIGLPDIQIGQNVTPSEAVEYKKHILNEMKQNSMFLMRAIVVTCVSIMAKIGCGYCHFLYRKV